MAAAAVDNATDKRAMVDRKRSHGVRSLMPGFIEVATNVQCACFAPEFGEITTVCLRSFQSYQLDSQHSAYQLVQCSAVCQNEYTDLQVI